MTLNDCVIDWKDTGICKIDLDIAKKYFNKKCFISKWQEKYTLVRYKYKRVRALKVEISFEDAKKLIDGLRLIEISSDIFIHASTFRPREFFND